MIDEEGSLHVVGRFKDLIIRGGENITPLAMKLCLASNPKLAAKLMQIVGQPNEVAGEAPVVIVGGDSDTIARVRGRIRREIPGQGRLSARDMAENDTVAKQINLVLRMLSGN